MTTSERVAMKDLAKLKAERAALDAEIARIAAAEEDTRQQRAASEAERAAQGPDVAALNACLTDACEAYMTGTLVWRTWLAEFRPLYDRLKESKHYPADGVVTRHVFNGLLGAAFLRARDYER